VRELSESDRCTITVNNREIQVYGGLTILQALVTEGIEVPSLCHDIRLERSNGNCGLCVVEVGADAPRDVKACLTPVQAGMVVTTHCSATTTPTASHRASRPVRPTSTSRRI
jgi:formate dehydrogenase major subunit